MMSLLQERSAISPRQEIGGHGTRGTAMSSWHWTERRYSEQPLPRRPSGTRAHHLMKRKSLHLLEKGSETLRKTKHSITSQLSGQLGLNLPHSVFYIVYMRGLAVGSHTNRPFLNESKLASLFLSLLPVRFLGRSLASKSRETSDNWCSM